MRQRAAGKITELKSLLVLALALILLLGGAYRMRDFLVDDAYIGFRYIQNCLDGEGLVFNPGERVEGVTNIGWLLCLMPFAAMVGPPAAAKMLGLVSATASVVLTYALSLRFWHGEKHQALFALPVPLFIVTQFDYIFYALGGMETALLSLVGVLLVYGAQSPRRPAWPVAGGAFSFLLHPECLLIYPLWRAVTWRLDGLRGSRRWLQVVGFAALIAAITGARYLYFGQLVPNTFYAKPTDPSGALEGLWTSLVGTNLNLAFPFRGLPGLALLLCGAWLMTRKLPRAGAMAAAVVGVGWLFSAYAERDWTSTARYFAPYIPLAFLLFWVGVVQLVRKIAGPAREKPIVPALLLTSALVIGGTGAMRTARLLSEDFVTRYPGYVMVGRDLVPACLWIRDHVPQDAVIATRRIGAVGYYSGRRVFDYKFGLIHKSVAHLKARTGAVLHNPGDPALRELWRGEAPDYLLENLVNIRRFAEEAGGTLDGFELHGMTYKLLKLFPLGVEDQWALCVRTDRQAPPGRPSDIEQPPTHDGPDRGSEP